MDGADNPYVAKSISCRLEIKPVHIRKDDDDDIDVIYELLCEGEVVLAPAERCVLHRRMRLHDADRHDATA